MNILKLRFIKTVYGVHVQKKMCQIRQNIGERELKDSSILMAVKMLIFRCKKCVLIFAQNRDCEYMLEWPF